jgi:imidazolonepropionase-like amidohydrolase
MTLAMTIRMLLLCVFVPALYAGTQAQDRADATSVVLLHARVIDGTGAPAREDQALVIERGKIARVTSAANVKVTEGVRSIDLRGQTILPGLVMLHEHLSFDPEGPTGTFAGVAQPQPFTAPRLYLAFGVTTIRTAATLHPYVDLNLKRRIDEGGSPGPEMFLTGPILNGLGRGFLDEVFVRDPEQARRAVRYWVAEGFTSIKAYAQLPKDVLAAVIEEAHALRVPVTAHLGAAVSCREAAELGIDSLEHGFGPCTGATTDDLGTDPDGPRACALIQLLVDKRVALVHDTTRCDRAAHR